MARKPRDYKAEERRRNELARARGYSTRAAQRGAIKRGEREPIAPHLTRRGKAEALQRKMDAAYDWSALYAKSPIAQFDLTVAEDKGIGIAKYTDAYTRAFVAGPERYSKTTRYDESRGKRIGGSDALYDYFVDLMEYYTPEEYDDQYFTV